MSVAIARAAVAGDPRQSTDDMLLLCLVDPVAVPEARVVAAAARLAETLSRRNGRPVHNPAVIARNLRLLGLLLPLVARRRLEALAIREERRSTIAAEQADLIERLFEVQGIVAQPVRGWDFARRFYPEPLVRHCHALRWLVPDPPAVREIERQLASAGWTATQGAALLAPHKRIFTGPDRIAVELHIRPFGWTTLLPDAGDAGTAAFVAAELIGASITDLFVGNARWAIDLVQLLRQVDVDVSGFARQVDRFGFAGYAATALGRVADMVHPDEVPLRSRLAALRGALADAAHDDSGAVRDIGLLKAMATARRRGFLLRACLRPDLIVTGRRLRAERRARTAGGAAARASLLQRLRDPSH